MNHESSSDPGGMQIICHLPPEPPIVTIGPDTDAARAALVDELTEAVTKAQRAGVTLAEARADFDALLSILPDEPYTDPSLPGDREAVHICDDQCGHGDDDERECAAARQRIWGSRYDAAHVRHPR